MKRQNDKKTQQKQTLIQTDDWSLKKSDGDGDDGVGGVGALLFFIPNWI